MDNSEFFSPLVDNKGYSGLSLMSESGFNVLYNAERDGKRFVVKGLKKEFQGDSLYESLLRKEFEIAYSLDHANICRTVSYEHFEEVGNAIVMEWIDGRTLEQFIKEKRTSEVNRRVIKELCDALSYAHKKQVIHRDIKPQNIIITYNGDNVKLLDFGLSDTDQHVVLKEPAGSRKYASPELLGGEKIDSRSDIYSLGIIISELFNEQMTTKISKVVTRATSYSPDSRYKDVETVWAALKGRRAKFIYPLLLVILLAVAYLFYTVNKTSDSLIPSAETDGVSVEEFEQREALYNKFLSVIDKSYVTLMNTNLYITSCATPTIPDLEELSKKHLEYYERTLDSMLSPIKKSSLYLTAKRNMHSYNSMMFNEIRASLPNTFWSCTEALYDSANDPLADSLRKMPVPMCVDNYSQLNATEQEAEQKRYFNAVQEYKKNTVMRWAINYRKENNMSELPDYILEYFDE